MTVKEFIQMNTTMKFDSVNNAKSTIKNLPSFLVLMQTALSLTFEGFPHST